MIGALREEVGSDLSQVLYVVENDFRNFFRYKMWLVGLIMMNLSDLFITALVYNKVLNPNLTIKNYFSFFAPGLRHRPLRVSFYDRP